jgi:hypothetical protein
MARLHRENRYDRMTGTVEEVTGLRAGSVEEFVTRRTNVFADARSPSASPPRRVTAMRRG